VEDFKMKYFLIAMICVIILLACIVYELYVIQSIVFEINHHAIISQ
jgi:uncharacterized membrane protein